MVAGLVTTRTVLSHPALILRAYGPRVFARCLLAIAVGERTTFLSLVWR